MADYDFTGSLSPLDFELLSKDLLEAELDIQLENFSEGRDRGIDLRYNGVLQSSRPDTVNCLRSLTQQQGILWSLDCNPGSTKKFVECLSSTNSFPATSPARRCQHD